MTANVEIARVGPGVTRPHRQARLRGRLRAHRASLLVLTPLLLLSGVVQALNMARYPVRIDDEGTYVAQAYAVQTFGTLSHYTYWYDHPPLGWLQLAVYTWSTDAFGRYSNNAVLAGREAMLVVQLASCVLLWALCRRLLMARWTSGLAVLLFSLSPLAIQFHRTVYLDNIATPWLIASFVLALTPQKRLSAFVGSALCFSVAVLSKETSILVLPALAVLLWRGTRNSGSRRYALTLAAVTFVLATSTYGLYALVKGEFLPGPGHVSLWTGVKFQLFSRPASGSVLTPGTLGYDHLHEWLNLDPVLPTLAVSATVIGLFMRRIRPVAIGFALLVLIVFKPGYLPVPFAIALLPLAAVVVAGVADVAAHWRPARWKVEARTLRHRVGPVTPVVAVVVVAALVAGALTWLPKLRGELRSNPDAPVAASERWIEHNIPKTARMAVDDAYWVDLVRAGFPRQNVVWYYKIDTDPAVEKLSPAGWRDYSYVVLTQSVRSDPQGLASLNKAVSSSVEVARFGTGLTAVDIRRVLSGGVAQVPRLRRADAVERLSAGTALGRNPALRIQGQARAELLGGHLDMRAATTLAQLTRTGPITVDKLPEDPAETAAGLAVRSMIVRGTTPTTVRAVIAGLPATDGRAVVRTKSKGTVQVTWPLAPVPAGSDY
ncbi:ArnT family glycosyltransferase [uncultured Jatrophihabitans sp.]|uniref:ArnT family glycosyltransferase n=1 Tax=uncultured Jatrophihabitans sp. TaxID=1610747 RepID=UPI0035CAC63E